VYNHASELMADDILPPLGKEVVTTTYVDAKQYHDLITSHAATGILHLVNNSTLTLCSISTTMPHLTIVHMFGAYGKPHTCVTSFYSSQ